MGILLKKIKIVLDYIEHHLSEQIWVSDLANLSYFHRAFKKKYGMTPRSFIKALGNYDNV